MVCCHGISKVAQVSAGRAYPYRLTLLLEREWVVVQVADDNIRVKSKAGHVGSWGIRQSNKNN
jgi:hypothetical protein